MKENMKKELEVNEYGNVDCRNGVPTGYVLSYHSKRLLKKHGIKYYDALVDIQHAFGNTYKPVLEKIISLEDNDILTAVLSAEAELEREKLKKYITKKKKIAEAIYSINKEAKKKRDLQNKWADRIFSNVYNDDVFDEDEYEYIFNPHRSNSVFHFHLHEAKTDKENLYSLKERALKKLIQETNSSPVGYHTFADTDRDMYVIEGFCFHLNERKSNNSLGSIENFIEADRKRSTPPAKAEKILNLYLEN